MNTKVYVINNQRTDVNGTFTLELPAHFVNLIKDLNYDKSITIITSTDAQAIYNARIIAGGLHTSFDVRSEFRCDEVIDRGKSELKPSELYAAANTLITYMDRAKVLIVAMDRSHAKKLLEYVADFFAGPNGKKYVCEGEDGILSLDINDDVCMIKVVEFK
jgi:hypothetical protein